LLATVEHLELGLAVRAELRGAALVRFVDRGHALGHVAGRIEERGHAFGRGQRDDLGRIAAHVSTRGLAPRTVEESLEVTHAAVGCTRCALGARSRARYNEA